MSRTLFSSCTENLQNNISRIRSSSLSMRSLDPLGSHYMEIESLFFSWDLFMVGIVQHQKFMFVPQTWISLLFRLFSNQVLMQIRGAFNFWVHRVMLLLCFWFSMMLFDLFLVQGHLDRVWHTCLIAQPISQRRPGYHPLYAPLALSQW